MRSKLLISLCVVGALGGYFAGSGLRILLTGRPGSTPPPRAEKSAPGSAAEEELDEVAAPESLDVLHQAAAAAATPAESRVLVLETISRLSGKQLEDLIKKHLEKPDFERLVRYDFQAAMRRLGEIQPHRAADIWLSGLIKTVALRRHLGAMLEPWMQKSPRDFIAWHMMQSEEAQKAMAAVVGQFAFTQPDRFAEYAESLSTSPAGAIAARRAVEGLRINQGKSPNLQAALEYARKLPEGRVRSAALVALTDWPGVDLAAEPDLQAALAALPFAARETKAAQWTAKADKLEAGPFKEAAIAAALQADATKDASGALKRLRALTGSPDYPAAARGYVEAVAERDPAGALEVCLTIPKGDPQRAIALDEAATHLFRKKPDQARKWVDQAALTEEEYFHLTGRKK